MANALVYQFTSSIGRHQHLLWQSGDSLPGGLELPSYDVALVHRFPRRIWNLATAPRIGRFYPSRLLPGRFPVPVFRVHACDGQQFSADLNPPIAALSGQLAAMETAELPPGIGTTASLLAWPGMECPLEEIATDFQDPGAFDREDEEPDDLFYREPRPVLHVDRLCASRIEHCYGQLITPGARVLDLMSGWVSHLPGGCEVTGLGMNTQELEQNPALQEYRVQDLNREPVLPFADASFDAVVNTLSIEYLIHPDAVLAEVLRVLRPGGRCVISFSNRYFPTKVIGLWVSLHPMERLGWTLQRLASAGFGELTSHVERGLPRPEDDRYAAQLPEADPLFVAWGTRVEAGYE